MLQLSYEQSAIRLCSVSAVSSQDLDWQMYGLNSGLHSYLSEKSSHLQSWSFQVPSMDISTQYSIF